MEDIVVIGAGPYGLSIAAHLAPSRQHMRVLGTPMQTWLTQMPKGMRLKSEGFASTLYDPNSDYRLSRYCADHGIAYADTGLPVPGQVFAEYGQEFARRYVPMLENRTVTGLRPSSAGFELSTADGQNVQARRVVCAVGITHYAYVAPQLAELPASVLSHSSAHHNLERFRGQTVAVVGGGASATDCAALLAEAGAVVHLLTRGASLRFHSKPRKRSLHDRVRWPMTTIGPGWKSVLCTKGPLAFHAMPRPFRLDVTRRYLGPAPCWFVRDQVETLVTTHTNTDVIEAVGKNGGAALKLKHLGGTTTLNVDHVVAATGYKVDLGRLPFLDEAVRRQLQVEGGAPVLSRWFESSIPNLFFVGASAANAFGPLLRFACGAEFAARRLARKLG